MPSIVALLTKRRWWSLVIAGGLLVALAGAAIWLRSPRALPNRVYRVFYNDNPPYYHRATDGKPLGAMVDLFNEAARRRGLQLEWVFGTGAPEDLLRTGQAELMLLSVDSPDRRREFHITEPWLRVEAKLVWRKSNGEAGIPDWRGRTLGVAGAKLYESVLRQQFAESGVVRRPSRVELIEMLCGGELDGVLLDGRSLSTVLLDRPRSCDGVSLGMDSVDNADAHLVILGRKDVAAVAEGLRAGVSEMTADGSIRRIFQHYGVGYLPELRLVNELEQSHSANQVLAYSLAAVVLALLIVIVLAVRLRRAERMAADASRAKSAFLATMSHETRTPLNGIIGLAEALAQDSSDAEQRRMAQTIAQCGRSMVSLVNDVLDHSKMDAGKLQVDRSVFSLRGMIEPIALNVASVAGQKQLEFHWHVDPALPHWVEGDELRITQVLFNLLGNAVKFTERGRVQLLVFQAGPLVRFEVRDTGIGLARQEQEQLFQAFWQANQGSTRRFGGTGLGLSICKRLVEAMGGTIEVESEVGKGSCFAIELQLPERPQPDRLDLNAASSGQVSLRILFADDNEVNRMVVQRMLDRMGHQVAVAVNGTEAVDRFLAQDFDLILLDCHMPVEDGFSACRRIRATDKGAVIPILALTALAFAEDRDRCIAAGMNGHITKPVSQAALAAALQPYEMAVISSRS